MIWLQAIRDTSVIDFVNGDYRLQRLSAQIDASNQEIDIQYQTADIDTMDSYEKCVKKLKNQTIEATRTATALKKMVGAVRYRFAYPEIEKSLKLTGANISILLKTLRAVIGTLDPTLQDVSLSKDLKDTFIIRRGGTEIIIQEGKLLKSGDTVQWYSRRNRCRNVPCCNGDKRKQFSIIVMNIFLIFKSDIEKRDFRYYAGSYRR